MEVEYFNINDYIYFIKISFMNYLFCFCWWSLKRPIVEK